MTIPRPSGQRAYEILVTPLPRSNRWLGRTAPAAAIFISDPEIQPEGTAQLFVRLYGLTSAEARLAAALMQGETLEQAADEFQLSRNTVRSQLAKIFEKTRTRRQGELIRLLWSGSARLF